MNDKYQGRYRIPSARAPWWDYGCNGAYFITICTKNMLPYFGTIRQQQMELTPTGAIADILWHDLKNRHPFLELGAYIIMPDHLHGILIINKTAPDTQNDDPPDIVQTRHALSPPENEDLQTSPAQSRYRNPGKGTISSIIGNYKSAVTRHARRLGYTFAWQSRFYDRIIPDDDAYQRHHPIHFGQPRQMEKITHITRRDKAYLVSTT